MWEHKGVVTNLQEGEGGYKTGGAHVKFYPHEQKRGGQKSFGVVFPRETSSFSHTEEGSECILSCLQGRMAKGIGSAISPSPRY